MNAAPDRAEIARLVALAEEGLRRRGFAEVAIKRARSTTRAQMTAFLIAKENR